jgi:hypothetical protein
LIRSKKKKPVLDAEMQLHTVPYRNTNVKTWPLEKDPKTLVVEVKLKPGPLLALTMKVLKARNHKKYSLVGLSRTMYEEVDGKNTVEDLINILIREFKLTFLESRALTLKYLSDLMTRGLIVVLPPGEVPESLSMQKKIKK